MGSRVRESYSLKGGSDHVSVPTLIVMERAGQQLLKVCATVFPRIDPSVDSYLATLPPELRSLARQIINEEVASLPPAVLNPTSLSVAQNFCIDDQGPFSDLPTAITIRPCRGQLTMERPVDIFPTNSPVTLAVLLFGVRARQPTAPSLYRDLYESVLEGRLTEPGIRQIVDPYVRVDLR